MMKITDIMTRNPVTIEGDKTVREAVHLMAETKLGSLMVCQDNEIVGILEEGDLIRKVMAKDLNPNLTRVTEAMSVPLIIDDQRSDDDASDMMKLHQVRHLAVSQDSQIVGIVSMFDLIRPVYLGRSFWG